MAEYFRPDGFPLPFSPAVKSGSTLYISGQVGMDPATGKLVEGGVEAEARQALENMQAVLVGHGASMDRVLKCTVMLPNIDDFARINAVYATFFPNNKPARSTFGVNGLAGGALFEIECIAELD